MSFCPLESYEWDGTKAECGSSGVLLMASLLPICDIRSRAQGNQPAKRRLRVCFGVFTRVRGEGEQRGQNSWWRWRRYREKQRLSKDELDMTRRREAERKWSGGLGRNGALGKEGRLIKRVFSLPGVKLSERLGGICCPTFPL